MGNSFVFDPRKLIAGPSGPCPACQRNELGTLEIRHNRITRRCRNCLYTASETLPQLRKKVVYLDQMVFSSIAKMLDPVWRAEKARTDNFWLRLFDALDRALKLQLIVCPQSRIHEQESVVHVHHVSLRSLYEHFAGDTNFQFPSIVHRAQLVHALRAELSGEDVDYGGLSRDHVLRGDVDGWMGRVQIRVRWGVAEPNPQLESEVRRRSGEAFEKIFAGWAAEKRSFEEYYQKERRGAAETMVLLYRDYVALVPRIVQGDPDALENFVNSRLEVETLLTLVAIVQGHHGGSLEAAFQEVWRFIYSDGALRAPANEISAMLMAALARRAAMGQKSFRARGMWNDITAISSFLPYCDAMFLDNECATLLAEGPLNERIVYPTRIFSRRTGEQFIEYLSELERAVGPTHVDLIVRTYGEEWLTPYRTILEYEREKAARRSAEAGVED